MDPIENPYTPNAGSRPPELTGRDAELQAFRILIGRLKRGHTEQSLIVRGLRGMGKTVLLNAFEDIAKRCRLPRLLPRAHSRVGTDRSSRPATPGVLLNTSP